MIVNFRVESFIETAVSCLLEATYLCMKCRLRYGLTTYTVGRRVIWKTVEMETLSAAEYWCTLHINKDYGLAQMSWSPAWWSQGLNASSMVGGGGRKVWHPKQNYHNQDTNDAAFVLDATHHPSILPCCIWKERREKASGTKYQLDKDRIQKMSQ